jgi:tetratricopeptide (TPR) repeat protein
MAHQLAEAHAEAREAFETYLEQSEAGSRDQVLWASAITGIGRSMRELGDPHGGAAFLEEELVKPGTESDVFRDARVLLGDLLFEIGRPAQALPVYRRVMAMARGDRLEARVTLRSAECLEAMDRLDEAAMEYIRVAYLYESVTDLATAGMIRAADLFERLGNYREAIRTYRRALDLAPMDEEKSRIEKRVAWLEEHLGLLELELREKE